jgi:hypothetical protein
MNEMFEKYIPFVVSTKYSGVLNATPSSINFNVANPGNSISSSIRRVVCRAERFICCTFCNMLTQLSTNIKSISLPGRSKPSAKLPLDTLVIFGFTTLKLIAEGDTFNSPALALH